MREKIKSRSIIWAISTLLPISQFADANRLQVGANYTYLSLGSEINGNMAGLQGSYEFRPPHSFYAAFKGMYREGELSGNRHLLDIDVQERLGYTFGCDQDKCIWTLFTGFGYRYLGNKQTKNHSVLHQNYNEYYVPVGSLLDVRFTSCFSLGFYLTWMPQVDPTVNLNPIHGSRWDINKRIANLLFEVPFHLTIKGKYLFQIKPFYEYWQDGPTYAETSTGLPLGLTENTYSFAGIELNFGYQF